MKLPSNRGLDQNPARLSIIINRRRSRVKNVHAAIIGIQLMVVGAMSLSRYLIL